MKTQLHIGKKLRAWFKYQEIGYDTAAEVLDYSPDYLNNAMGLADPPDEFRRRVCIHYPETRPFMIPEWARLDSNGQA